MSCLDDNTVAALFDGKLPAETRARVEAHVDQCSECRRLVAKLAVVLGPGAALTADASLVARSAGSEGTLRSQQPAVVAEGQVVAERFRVGTVIGSGGMGTVYAATHVQLGHKLALKVMSPALASHPVAVQRFLNEARTAANIASDHVVRVTDVGTLPGGVPFLAMEYLEGEDLSDVLKRRGRLPIEEAVDLVLEALEGIAHAHALGIVHRDLKLANLFLARRPDGTRRVKVLDFGISKVDPTLGATGESSTVTGVVLGTPHYMAPEQLRDAKGVDARADIWAVGVILYKLLTGTLPFVGESIASLILAIGAEGLPSLRGKRPETPPELERVVMRCLARDVDDRWPDAASLARALAPSGSAASRASARRISQVLGSEPDKLRSLQPPPRGRRWVLASLSGLVATGAMVSVVAVAASGSKRGAGLPATGSIGSSASPSGSASTMADLPAYGSSNAEAMRAFRDGLAERRGGSNRRGSDLLRKAVALDPSFPPAHVELLLAIGTSRVGAAERAEYETAAALREQMTPRDRAMLDALEPIMLRVPAEWGEAEARLRRAADAFPRDAEVFWLLGWATATRSLSEGARWTQRAIELDPAFAGAYGDLVEEQRYAGPREQAHANADRCLEALPGAMNCLYMQAAMAEEEGRCQDLERFARRMIAIDPEFAMSQAFLAKALASNGSPAGAREILAAMPRVQARRWRSNNMPNEAQLEMLVGEFGEAETLAREAASAAATSDAREAHAGPVRMLVQLDLETGKLDDATKLANDFLTRSSAWEPDPDDDDFALMADPTPTLLGALRTAGRIGAKDLVDRRASWLAKWPRARQDVAPYLWAHGYGDVCVVDGSGEDVNAAIAEMPSFPAPLRYFPAALPSAGIGVTLAQGGRAVDALPWLEQACKSCRAASAPFEQTRALYWLGRVRELTGDRDGACAAYDAVIERWGKAKPKSVTADQARGRRATLGCGAR
jgi:serine/threonine-protein kinase